MSTPAFAGTSLNVDPDSHVYKVYMDFAGVGSKGIFLT
jgi:hypothetical protein